MVFNKPFRWCLVLCVTEMDLRTISMSFIKRICCEIVRLGRAAVSLFCQDYMGGGRCRRS